MHRDVLHAIDLLALQDWDAAKAALEASKTPDALRLYALVTELEQREVSRHEAAAFLRHEVGNALSIVRANLEAIIDGVLPATPERLRGMHAALTSAIALMDDA